MSTLQISDADDIARALNECRSTGSVLPSSGTDTGSDTAPIISAATALTAAVDAIGTGTAMASYTEPALTYTPLTAVEYILQHPGLTLAEYAAAFGRKSSWMAGVLSSDSFQSAITPYRHLIHDPAISGTMEERFRALTVQSLSVLQTRLDRPDVADLTITKAVEIGVKALGMGQVTSAKPEAPPGNASEAVAERILAAMERQAMRAGNHTAIDATVVEVPSNGS